MHQSLPHVTRSVSQPKAVTAQRCDGCSISPIQLGSIVELLVLSIEKKKNILSINDLV